MKLSTHLLGGLGLRFAMQIGLALCFTFTPHKSRAATTSACVDDEYDFPCTEECPDDCPAGSGGGGGCGSCGGGGGTIGALGMPVWRVSQPGISLWIDDEPLGYSPSRGPRVSFKLSFKQRESVSGLDPSVFSTGPLWNLSWFSYVHASAGSDNWPYVTRLPGGGGVTFEEDEIELMTRMKLERVQSGGATTHFNLHHWNGAKDVYGYVVTNSAGVFQKAFLTQLQDPQGNVTSLTYETNNPANPVIRLKYVVDADNRTNYVHYNSTNAYSTNLISHVVDAHGRTNFLVYNDEGLLTNIVDVAGISSSMKYDDNNWVTNLVTPYGTTSFSITTGQGFGEGIEFFDKRAVKVTEPNGASHLYLARECGSPCDQYLPPAFPDAQVPNTTNANFAIPNLFHNYEMNWRNTIYWSPLQFEFLSTNYLYTGDILNLTSNDFLVGHVKHWLNKSGIGAASHAVNALSMERFPTPSGQGEGRKIWYDYEGIDPSNRHIQGTNSLPRFVAEILPDGNTHFTYYLRNHQGKPTQTITTYNKADGSVDARTNLFTYQNDGVDLDHVYGPDGTLKERFLTYNSNHQVLTHRNAADQTNRFLYDASSHQLTSSLQTGSGLLTTNLYNADNQLITSIDLMINRTNSYTYNNGLVHTHTDERGLLSTFTYDPLQRVTSITFPDNTYISNRYTHLDLTASKDRMGNWNYFAYDAARKLVATTNAASHVTLYDYCDCGSLNSITDPDNKVTSFDYDLIGQRVGTHFPDGSWVSNHFDLAGRLTRVTDSSGSSLTNWYSNQGLLIASSNALGQALSRQYDINDLLIVATDANGLSLTNSYDVADRLIHRSYPDGGIESFGYSPAGLIFQTNQLGNVTQFVYDAGSRKTSETNALGEVVQYAYSPGGELLTLTDGKGQVTTWKYDEYGQVTNKTDHLNAVLFTYQYDANGRLTSRWSPAKGSTDYDYDSRGNLTGVDYPSSPDLTFAYDALNRLTNMVDGVGASAYGYDAVGQLLREDGPWSADMVSYTYSHRLKTALSLEQPDADSWSQSYSYDAAKRLASVSSDAGAFAYTYHGGLNGLATSSSLIKRLLLPNTAHITNAFDTVGRVLDTSLRSSANVWLNIQTYQYNAAHQRTRHTRNTSGYMNYAYDGIGQLTSARGVDEEAANTNRFHEQFGYDYDAAGNLNFRTNNALVQTFLVNGLNQLTNATRAGTLTIAGVYTGAPTNVNVDGYAAMVYDDGTYAVTNRTVSDGTNYWDAQALDALGRAAQHNAAIYLPANVNYVHDQNGNMLTDGRRHFEYDDENQLIAVTYTNATRSEFKYDGKMRRRVLKESVWQNGAWQETGEVRYVYEGNLVIQERHYQPAVSMDTPQFTVTYTRGLDLSGSIQEAGGIGGLLARSVFKATGTGLESAYYHSDANGNVSAMTDEDQEIAARYLYDPFGGLINQQGPLAQDNLYRFSSKEFHEPSGLVYYLYRFYDPNLQRWPIRDPLGEPGFEFQRRRKGNVYGDGANRYEFVLNDPIGKSDRFGLQAMRAGPGGGRVKPKSAKKCCEEKGGEWKPLWKAAGYRDSKDCAEDLSISGAASSILTGIGLVGGIPGAIGVGVGVSLNWGLAAILCNEHDCY